MTRRLAVLEALLGVLLALTPFVLWPVCSMPKPDGGHMLCWYSGILITAIGVLVVLFSILAWWKSWSFLLAAAAALLAWMAPNDIIHIAGAGWAVGLCGMANHACRAVTMPAVGWIVLAIVLIGIAGLVSGFVGKR